MSDETIAQTTIPIDSERAARAVAERFPDLAPVHAVHFGQGWDFHMFAINDRYLFRFPKRPDSFERMRREQRVLSELGAALTVPVPHFRFVAERSAAFDAPFAGYEKLPGTLACHVDPARVDTDAVLEQVVDLLGALARVPIAALREAGIESEPAPSLLPVGGLDEVRRRLSACAVELSEALCQELEALVDHWRDVPLPIAESALVHSDLTSVHVLVDEATGRLSGVIDWGDVAIKHPICDLIGWYGWLGRVFAERLVHTLGLAEPEAWLSWLRASTALLGLSEVYYAIRHTQNANDLAHGRRCLQRAFES